MNIQPFTKIQKVFLHLVYAYKNRLCVKYLRFTMADLFGEKREVQGIYNPTSGEGVEK